MPAVPLRKMRTPRGNFGGQLAAELQCHGKAGKPASPDSDASDQYEISGAGAWNCLPGNGPVECSEPAVISNGQAQQIPIRDLLMSADHGQPKQRLIQKGHRIPPEMMVRRRTKTAEAFRRVSGSRFYCRVCGVAQDADKTVDCHRACGPTVLSVPAEPTMRVFMVGVSRIEESHQHIHVQEGDTQRSSRNWFTIRRSGFAAPALGTKSKAPLRVFAGAVAANDCRASSEMTLPSDTPCSRAICLAVPRRSSSSSNVVRTTSA